MALTVQSPLRGIYIFNGVNELSCELEVEK